MNVFLIRMTNHTHSQNFEARWEALTGTASEADYTHTTASQTSNDSQTLENRMGRSFPTTTDALIEGAETFTIKARGGETQGEFNSNDDLRCQITIIDLYVTQINMVSTPSSGDIYRIGETIEFSATFNTEVEVEGTVNMGFYIGDQWKGANYRRGSGTKTLIFGYEVQIPDKDSLGVRVPAGYIDSDGQQHGIGGSGTITAVGTDVEAYPIYDGIPRQAAHKVDSRPYVTKVEIVSTPADGRTYRHGETIEIDMTFSAPVRPDATARPYVVTIWGTTQRNFKYSSGSGTNTLRFARTVVPQDRDDNGFLIDSVLSNQDQLRGIIWAQNHDVRATYVYSGFEAGNRHKINGQPYIENFAITSSPAYGNRTYRRGETIQVTFTFDQKVQVDGEVKKKLNIGGSDIKLAPYTSGSGTKDLAFEYIFSAGIPIIMASPSSLAARTAVGLAVGPSGPCSHRAMPVERK